MATQVTQQTPQILLVATALIAACFVLAFHSTLSGLLNAWAANEDYSHGFLIIPISLYLIWRKRQELATLKIYSSKSGLAIIVIALFLSYFERLKVEGCRVMSYWVC